MRRNARMVCWILACVVGCVLMMQPMAVHVSATANPTAIGLTEFAIKALHDEWGFIYGTSGQIVTQSLIDSKARQYPDIFAAIRSDGQTTWQYARKWIGHRAADCVGLEKAYLWWQGDTLGPGYSSAQDRSANGLYNLSTIRGPISTLPETHGLMLWREGHVGIYVGNGEVIESRGVEYGVVKTRVTDREWVAWFRNPYIAYNASGWTAVSGQTFYYKDGACLTGLQVIDGQTYYFGKDGARQSGFLIIDGKTMYFRPDGVRTSGWLTLDGSSYFMDAGGIVQTGWQTINGKRCLFSSRGVLLTGWQEDRQSLYYLNAQGEPLTGAVEIDGRSYVFESDGRLSGGWRQTEKGWQYLSRSGLPLTGLQIISGAAFWLDPAGIRGTGWQESNGERMYFDPESGAGVSSGLHSIGGQPYLFDLDGTLAQPGSLVFAGGSVYLAGESSQPRQGTCETKAWAAPEEPGMDPVLATARLSFADDHALSLTNQTVFSLSSERLMLACGPDSADSAGSLTLTGQQPAEAGQWMSLDLSVAKISADGTVAAAGPGRTLVLFQTGAGYYAACLVTVMPDWLHVTADDPITLEPGLSARLTANGLPGCLYAACQFASSDPEIISVSPDGVATALQAGTAIISLSCDGAAAIEWTVTAADPLLGLSAGQQAICLPVGGVAAGWAHPAPSSFPSAGMIYSSSNPDTAQVGPDGTIRGISEGSAVITAQLGDFKLSCNVTVSGAFQALRPGSSGEQVRQMQERLAALGYWTGQPDGCYGHLTEFAVSCFQEKRQLPATGHADPGTLAALFAGQAPAADEIKSENALQPGDTGVSVTVLQRRLYELNYLKKKPDGQFDDMTMTAVKTLQVINGFSTQDFADKALIASLFSRAVKSGKSSLRKGDSGYEVQVLQARLKALYFYPGSADGIFGVTVEAAVVAFQISAGLPADGVAGSLTQIRLYAPDAPAGNSPDYLAAGSVGEAVLSMERQLVFLGYHYALPDTVFDSLTTASVKAFQQRAGLSQTGVADTATLALMFSETAPYAAATYRSGSRGENVRRIQNRLNQLGFSCGTADGRFKYRTYRAVRAFQSKNGLKVDGIIGSRAAARLFYVPATTGDTAVAAPAPDDQPARPALSAGSSGEAVLALETQLVALGYHCALADNVYDSLTAISVKNFQRRAGLSQNGQADATTQARLFSAAAPRSSATCQLGSSGDHVKRIQARLSQLGYPCGTPDGRFGRCTDRAVRAFQRNAGLLSDGHAGSRTIAILFSPSAPEAN